jgi:2-oxoglutarate ferredoxin oxidoreductase subunit alpha
MAKPLNLAEKFQTPIFVSDRPRSRHEQLDVRSISNIPLSQSIAAKSWTAAALEKAGESSSRYKDVDGDGIPYRTLPGTDNPMQAAYFTRGSGHTEKATYTESPEDYVNLMNQSGEEIQYSSCKFVPASHL